MARDYGRIHTAFWTDEKVRAFSDDGRLLAAYLLSCPHSNVIGAFLLPDAYIIDDLGWERARVVKGLDELVAAGFVQRFKDKRHIVLCNYMRWNKPENPNVAKAAAKQALKLPVDDPAFEYVRKGFETVSGMLPEDLRKLVLNGSGRVREGLSKQEPEPEPEPKPKPEPESQPAPEGLRRPTEFERLVETLGGFEAVRKWTNLREMLALWLGEADFDADILPAIREALAKRANKLPQSPSYFTGIIREQTAKRLSGSNGKGHARAAPPIEVGTWKNYLRVWKDDRKWDRRSPPDGWGPAPGEPGCLVPAELLAEASA